MEHERMKITNDSLNWANGDQVITVERGVQPFPTAAGVDGTRSEVQPPERLGPLTSSPFAGQGNQNMESILRGSTGGKR